jgi:hypothetical protein
MVYVVPVLLFASAHALTLSSSLHCRYYIKAMLTDFAIETMGKGVDGTRPLSRPGRSERGKS